MLGAADPDFLTVDYIVVALPPSDGRDTGGVGTGTRLGHTEGLQAQFPACDLGKIGALLFFRSMLEKRTHRVHLRMAGPAVRA